MATDNAPIAFFAYRRPAHAKASLEALSKCEGAKESELYIFSDGAKDGNDRKSVEEVRELIAGRKWCGRVNIIERERNLGLAASIISGVTELCEKYGRAIVLEDDLVVSPQFLNYMNDALNIYQSTPEVMHISGYILPIKAKLPETFFYRATTCWGWATWKRAWDSFEPDPKKLLDEIVAKGLLEEFDVKGSTGFSETLKANAEGRMKTWAIRWYASVFLKGGLCLHPGESLVSNIGLDGSGVHCGKSNDYDVKVREQRIKDFTGDIRENEAALNAMAEFYKSIGPSLGASIINGLKSGGSKILRWF